MAKVKTFVAGEPLVNEIADECSTWPEYVMKCQLRGVDVNTNGIYNPIQFREYKTYARWRGSIKGK